MNEKILKLAEQAEVYYSDGEYREEDLAALQKFADLIVKECTGFLKDTLDDHFAAEQLEEYFGVENERED